MKLKQKHQKGWKCNSVVEYLAGIIHKAISSVLSTKKGLFVFILKKDVIENGNKQENGYPFKKAISNNKTRLIEHDLGHRQSWQNLPQYLGLGKRVNFFREN